MNASVPAFVQALRREGVRTFTDRAGRDWGLHTYCTMVFRTASRQTEVLAVLTADSEHDLYMVSSHDTTCALYVPYKDRIYSRSDTDPDFPPLATVFGKVDPAGPDTLAGTWLNTRPNCLHVLLPRAAVGRTNEEIQKTEDLSSPHKSPFSRDSRSENQITTYHKKERARVQWLADYRRWERYRVTLESRVPGRFKTFLHQKQEDGERYRLWRLGYHRRTGLLEHPKWALPGANKASVANAKSTGYLFDPENPKGLAKGRAFSSHLGYNVENWRIMHDGILEAIEMYPVTYRNSSIYGKLYSQLVILQGVNNKPVNALLGWIIRPDDSTWLITAHMKEF